MNVKTLLKSIIGTVAIYGVLLAFIFIFRDIVDFLVHFSILVGAFIACSIAAGLLFKGKIYAWVWTVASVLFVSFIWNWNLEFIAGMWRFLMPLLIPFLLVKAIFISINEKKELSAQIGTTEKETRSD